MFEENQHIYVYYRKFLEEGFFMHWVRFIPIIFFSATALSLFSFQAVEIIGAIQELIEYYFHKS